jgi:vacuolar protein-sorting-associated protein 4
LATIKLQIGSDAHKLTDADLHWLAEQTDGFSGDDIATLFKEALYAPLRLTRDSSHFKKVPGPGAGADDGVWEPCAADAADAVQMSILDVPQGKLKDVELLGLQHVKAALLKTKKSVGSEDLERYEEWTKEFGQDGAE